MEVFFLECVQNPFGRMEEDARGSGQGTAVVNKSHRVCIFDQSNLSCGRIPQWARGEKVPRFKNEKDASTH